MKKTLKIDTYDPVIYPRLFWVTDELEGLDRVFEFITIYSGGEKTTDFEELMKYINDNPSGMVTCAVMRKSDSRLGVIVIVLDIDDITPDMIPHEAVHVADYFCNQLDIVTTDFKDGNEHYAYLAGWAGGCISKTVSNRLKDREYDNCMEDRNWDDVKTIINIIRPNTFDNSSTLEECKYYKKIDLNEESSEYIY